MNVLILGGSGFVSGRLAQLCLKEGWQVWTVTRGARPLDPGVHAVIADRNDEEAMQKALAACCVQWDVVFDCICFNAEQAAVDLHVLPAFTKRLIVVSTDSVYHPAYKRVPQDENGERYLTDGGYGAKKREMEEYFEAADTPLHIAMLRPGHIFGPGSKLGCFPEHSRQEDLIQRIEKGEPLRLVGSGKYLIQPIFVDDLCKVMMQLALKPNANGIFCIGGPDTLPNAVYYIILGDILGHNVTIEEIPEEGYLEAHPECSGHLCHRSYKLDKLASHDIVLPATTLREGLTRQVEWIREQEKNNQELRP